MTTKLAKWASEHDQIIKSRLSYGHQANPLHQKRGLPTIGSDLMVIWEMSAYSKISQERHQIGNLSGESGLKVVRMGPGKDWPEGTDGAETPTREVRLDD